MLPSQGIFKYLILKGLFFNTLVNVLGFVNLIPR